ncbi:multidrug ABC transporter permease [Bacillus mycoides]|uniref:Multidrug ABC transporter permease n=1 Tax=Bacillus mycoides TaxID=1405 RepID=A0A109FY29_BACMY|nr:multidrug ABC transporter permease [Bacillus mycoides]
MRLLLIAGYQEETFVGDKEKLGMLAGVFSYLIGIATFLLPFGLETIGDAAGIDYGIFIVFSTIILLIGRNAINKAPISKS